jgi:hypothetical protein
VYDYLGASNLEFRAISFAPNVTNEQRSQLEKESEAYYQEDHPEVHYAGFVGLEPDFKSPLGMSVQPRSQQPFYFPQYLLEPEDGNDRLIEFDLYSSQQRAINFAVENFTPMVSSPSSAIPSDVESLSPMVLSPSFIIPPDQANYVILVHPGLHLSKDTNKKSLGVAVVYVGFEGLIKRATQGQAGSTSVYIYDTTDSPRGSFFGGTTCPGGNHHFHHDWKFYNDVDLPSLREKSSSIFEEVISWEQREWTVVVVDEGKSPPGFVILICNGSSALLTKTIRSEAQPDLHYFRWCCYLYCLHMSRSVDCQQDAQAEDDRRN